MLQLQVLQVSESCRLGAGTTSQKGKGNSSREAGLNSAA